MSVGRLKSITVIFIFVLFLVLATISGIYWYVFRGGSVGFYSNNNNLKWKLNREKLVETNTALHSFGLNELILVELPSDYLEIPSSGAGWDRESDAVYYAEWTRKNNFPILKIYVNEFEFARVAPADRNYLISYFVVQKIGERLGLEGDTMLALKEVVVDDKDIPFLEIISNKSTQ